MSEYSSMHGNQTPLCVEAGSGNVFADLGLEDAPALQLKADVVGRINSILRERGLSPDLFRLPRSKVDDLRDGKLQVFSREDLLELMFRLDMKAPLTLPETKIT